MLKNYILKYINIDKTTSSILKKGFIFCFILCIISLIILIKYNFINSDPSIYYLGICLFKLSTNFFIEFIICAYVVDGIINKNI